MLREMTALMAAAALMVSPAMASPLGGSLAASESGETAEKRSGSSLFSLIFSHVGFSIEAIRMKVAHNSAESAEHAGAECEEAKSASDEKAKGSDGDEEKPKGPEPLYFGF